ncbi:MAG: DUF4336 domain-containing protein [Gammaproteobacteria bacterium]|nr:DUF4336 domain-containing protein [Gammaproteobacteria bacterium]
MRKVHEDVWVVDRPFRLMGLGLGVRMTVVRLSSGGLVLHSPVGYEAGLQEWLDSLGEVCAIIAPNCEHNLFLAEWIRAYPRAVYYHPAGMVPIKGFPVQEEILDDAVAEAWRGELEQHVMRGLPRLNEVVFYHKKSRALIVTDLVFNITRSASLLEKLLLRLNGAYHHFGPTRLFKTFFMKDKAAFGASIKRLLEWDFERIILSHGEIVEQDGKEKFRRAFDWLL